MKNGGPISEHTCVHDAGCHARLLATSDVGLNISESSLPEAVENVSLQLGHRRRKWFHEVEHEVKHDVDKGAQAAWNAAKCQIVDLGCKKGVHALDKFGDKECEADHVSSVASDACKKAKAGSSLPEAVENVSLQLGHRRRKWFHEVEHEVKHDVDKGAQAAWNAAKCPIVDLGCKEGVHALDKFGDKECEADHVSSVASDACKKAKAGSSLMGPCKSAMKAALNAACKAALKNGGPISEHTCVHDAGCHAR